MLRSFRTATFFTACRTLQRRPGIERGSTKEHYAVEHSAANHSFWPQMLTVLLTRTQRFAVSL